VIEQDPADLPLRAAIEGVSAAFASLGRVFLCVDAGFNVVHASSLLDRLIGRGAAESARGRPVADLLGAELFGNAGTLRQLLLAGERREGWRAMLTVADTRPRLVSLTAAPFHSDPATVCDPRVAYIVVLRPAEEDQAASGAGSPFPGLIGRSPAMEKVFRLVENLEHSETTVLLTGESGTGKEVVTRAVHSHSPPRRRPGVDADEGEGPREHLHAQGRARPVEGGGAVPDPERERLSRRARTLRARGGPGAVLRRRAAHGRGRCGCGSARDAEDRRPGAAGWRPAEGP
jgi:transcriptional regulator of acetoin/glycerol metabolism